MPVRKLILHLEDDENDSLLLRRCLARVGFGGAYRQITNGEQGMAYLQGEGEYVDREEYPLPDLIVCDIKMPRMNGLEFIRWLRDSPQFAKTSVVTLSGSEEPQDKAAAANLGVDHYLVKNATVTEMEDQARMIADLAQGSLAGPHLTGSR